MKRFGLYKVAGVVKLKRLVFVWTLLSFLILLVGELGFTASAREPDSIISKISAAGSPSEVIQLVNQLRKANGLPSYQVNSALMAAAQAHSEYQAAIGSVTHTGSGGSRPHDRAVSMGYGGGRSVSVSENIMGGNGITAQKAVQWWQGDAPHLNTMLSPNYQDVGAGVAVSGNAVYITLVVGYVADATSPQDTVDTAAPGILLTATPAPTLEIIVPVSVSTPKPDGSIIHEVREGQTLWEIADTYEVDLSIMLILNGLNQDSVIYPGEKLLLKTAETALTIEPSATISATLSATTAPITPTKTVSASRTPTVAEADFTIGEATPVAMVSLGENNVNTGDTSETQVESMTQISDPKDDMPAILVFIAILVVLGTALLLASSLLRRET